MQIGVLNRLSLPQGSVLADFCALGLQRDHDGTQSFTSVTSSALSVLPAHACRHCSAQLLMLWVMHVIRRRRQQACCCWWEGGILCTWCQLSAYTCISYLQRDHFLKGCRNLKKIAQVYNSFPLGRLRFIYAAVCYAVGCDRQFLVSALCLKRE